MADLRAGVLVVGAGVSGLAFADRLMTDDYLICEASDDVGGYCRTVHHDGFVWDYSGHFFHFQHAEIEADLLRRLGSSRVRRVTRVSKVLYGDRLIDFPFQRHIDQLPHNDFVECLNGLGARSRAEPTDFLGLLMVRYGRGICDKFLVPYNEKVYATDLSRLDVQAMGRFFPHAETESILSGLGASCPPTYNSTFLYPEGGAMEFARALQRGVCPSKILCDEPVLRVDLARRLAHTRRHTIRYERLVSSVPLPRLLGMSSVPHDADVYSHNKVLVFNLGFDSKGRDDVHWIYVPDPDVCFYRVGFYDNVWPRDRMSLYVELGVPAGQPLDALTIEHLRDRVLRELKATGIVAGHQLVASHHVVLDPAYVHITERSNRDVVVQRAKLAALGVHTLGRYGTWTYCSIEDNIVEARKLADSFNRPSAKASGPSMVRQAEGAAAPI